MFGALILILISPFLPFFMYGFLVNNINQNGLVKKQQVLGKQIIRNNSLQKQQKVELKKIQKNNPFLLNKIVEPNISVARKSDYADIKIWAHASVVLDVDSGTILHYDNGRERRQIASLTKLMTATLVLKKVKNLDELITITPTMLKVAGTTVGCPSSVYCNAKKLQVGEKISVRNLLTAMLLDSANDAATALGIYVGGSKNEFVSLMNNQAKDWGLKDTHFCTPSGLEITGRENECYSSAYDVARIAVKSLQYPLIWKTMEVSSATVYSADGKIAHKLKNTDKLLTKLSNCIGGKTGFTPLAGKSLMLGAISADKKHKIVAVLLDDPNRWDDMQKLVKWTFNNYQWK